MVAHDFPLAQRQAIVHAHAGEMPALAALEVGARTLRPQHPHLATAVVALDLLDGGVAAAPDDERGIRANEARGIDEKVEAVEFFRRRGVPARVHGDTIPETHRSLKVGRHTRPRQPCFTLATIFMNGSCSAWPPHPALSPVTGERDEKSLLTGHSLF